MKKSLIGALVFLLLIGLNADVLAQTRISFVRGRTSATVSGRIYGNGENSYVLRARRGQFLSANLSSRSDCILFTNGATSTSYITRSGNNYLYLTNRCGGTTTFTLTVSINYGSD